MAICASMLPACLRVVPRPEKKMAGGGESEASALDHLSDPGSMMACRREEVTAVCKGRREKVVMDEKDGCVRRVVRILAPWSCR